MKNTIVVRTDGAKHIGTGHVYRCLTLAKSLKKHSFVIIFVMVNFDRMLIELVKSSGFIVISLDVGDQAIDFKNEKMWLGNSQEFDAINFIEEVRRYSPVCCIVDHYSLDRKWETIVSEIIPVLVVIDDLANRPHISDIVIDQNYWPNFEKRYDYLVPADCVKLLGPSYCLLREEFAELRSKPKPKNSTKKIMVNFGGIGNYELLKMLCNAISKFCNYEFMVITGNLSENHLIELQNYIKRSCNHVSVIEYTDNLAQLMSESDFSFGASGSTVWERFCLGLNSALLSVANNQIELLSYLSQESLVDNLGCINDISEGKIIKYLDQLNMDDNAFTMRKQSIMSMVDGDGAKRVSNAIIERINYYIQS